MHFVLVSLLLAHNETQSVLHLVHPAPHAKLCQVCEKGTRGLWRIKELQDCFVFIYLFKPHNHAWSTAFVLFVFTILTSIHIFDSILLTRFSHLFMLSFSKGYCTDILDYYFCLVSHLITYFPFKSLLATFVLHMYKWKLRIAPGMPTWDVSCTHLWYPNVISLSIITF